MTLFQKIAFHAAIPLIWLADKIGLRLFRDPYAEYTQGIDCRIDDPVEPSTTTFVVGQGQQ